MRGSPFYPQVPEVRMGQLILRAEDNPDSEKCPIRAQIFVVLWLFLQSKRGLPGLATGSRKETRPFVRPRHQTQITAGKIDINVKRLALRPALDV